MLWRRAIPTTASLLLALLVSPLAAGAPKSWLIDAAKFHISAHGQLSCATCHDSIASDPAHPDPRYVNQPPTRPDPAEGCLMCHDAVRAGMAEGKHGGISGQNAGQFRNCVACHNPHTVIKAADRVSKHVAGGEPPQPSADDARCMVCHDTHADTRERAAPLCLHCHADGTSEAQLATGRTTMLIGAAAYRRTPHAIVACATCHPNAAAYGHAHQAKGNCLRCHNPHYAQARDPHVNVDCRACHVFKMSGAKVRITPHDMVRHTPREACERCHFNGNLVGASAVVLPAKGILCVGCHAATLSVNDAVTIPSLVVFLLGLVVAMSLWLSGSGKLIGRVSILAVLKSLLFDTLLQRRLRRQSTTRWAIHSLIFLPIVIRFAWGMAALVASWAGARGAWYLMLIDKNHPVSALLFDLTGLAVLVGVCAAIARGIATRRQQVPGLPGQDHTALALIGSVVVIGFVLEGMRMAMTGASGGAAFLGYAISHAFTAGPALGRAYGFVWYLHAAFTGAFVAYLPFSRMFHILVAPVALAARAVRRET